MIERQASVQSTRCKTAIARGGLYQHHVYQPLAYCIPVSSTRPKSYVYWIPGITEVNQMQIFNCTRGLHEGPNLHEGYQSAHWWLAWVGDFKAYWYLYVYVWYLVQFTSLYKKFWVMLTSGCSACTVVATHRFAYVWRVKPRVTKTLVMMEQSLLFSA